MCKILGQEDIKPHKVRYYLQRRDAEFEQKMAEDRLAKARMRGDGPPMRSSADPSAMARVPSW